MKVLFLDIDGVLNTKNFDCFDNRLLDRAKVVLINQFVIKHDIRVVISSTWRTWYEYEEMKSIFFYAGFEQPDRIIGVTDCFSSFRGDEIDDWLDKHPEVTHYAILDDGFDFYHYHQTIHPFWFEGITEVHIKALNQFYDEKYALKWA